MVRRWVALLIATAAAATHCTLVTDFDGIAELGPDGAAGSGGGGGEKPFPRLALYETANPKSFEDPVFQADAARLDLVIMGIYPGWEQTHGPVEQVVQNVKALNPETKLFITFDASHYDTGPGSAYQAVIDKLNLTSSWLYTNGSTGALIESSATGKYIANTTLFTPKDADGHTFIEWLARWTADTWFSSSPSLDGILIDDLSWRAEADGDFNRDGTTDAANSSEASKWYRDGFAKYFSDLAQVAPNKYRLGALHKLGDVGASAVEFEPVLEGGLVSDLIGRSYSEEGISWWNVMTYYRRGLEIVREPKLVVFHMVGAVDDYRTFRYGFASCLMDDGYFAFNDVTGGVWGLVWFDELDAKLGGATSPPPTVAWSNGVWRRDFENGIALVNPRGNGTVTVELETPFRRLSGTQDPIVNDGSTTSSVTLAERDGIVLLR